MRTAGWWVGALLCPVPAAAFEYWEHAEIADEALAAVCAEEGTGELCAVARDWPRRWDVPGVTVTVGDLTALAGDHAIAPEALIGRFFAPGRRRLNADVWVNESPEDVRQTPIDRAGFFGLAREPRFAAVSEVDDWPACSAAKKEVWDAMKGGVLRWDGSYGANAAHGVSHFRIPGAVSPELLWARRSDRTAGLPALHALSWYGDAHAGALALARAAADTDGDARDARWRAAVTLEAFALHFLQDASSVGHIGSDQAHRGRRPARFLRMDAKIAGGRIPLRRKRYHDTRNHEGAPVQLTPAAFEALGVAVSADAVPWFGDGIVSCTEDTPTERLAIAATARSLAELARAAAHADLRPGAPARDAACAPDGLEADLVEVDALLCGWWSAPVSDAGDARARWIKALWMDGYFGALGLLPLPEASR